jgi:hypothetical protein
MAIQDLLKSFGQRLGSGLTQVGGYDPMQQVSPEEAARRRLEGLSALQRGLGKSAAILSGDPRRQELFQQQAEKRIAEANQQNLTTNAVAIAKENGATPEQIALIKSNPQLAMSVAQSSFDQKTDKLPTSIQLYEFAKSQGFQGSFIDFINSKKSPVVSINDQRESEFQKQATASAFKIINETTKDVNDFADIEGRLGILQKQLEGGNLETGIFEELKIPFKRLAAGLNILPQEDLDKLDAQELFQRTVNFIVPRLRVSGSGSTSDTEVQLFRESAPALGLTQGGNLLIVGGMSAIAKHNRKRLKLMNKYIADEKLGNGDLIGFGEYADQILGPVFKSYDSNESFDQQVKKGILKAGDFVYDGLYGDFRILTEEDVQGIK